MQAACDRWHESGNDVVDRCRHHSNATTPPCAAWINQTVKHSASQVAAVWSRCVSDWLSECCQWSSSCWSMQLSRLQLSELCGHFIVDRLDKYQPTVRRSGARQVHLSSDQLRAASLIGRNAVTWLSIIEWRTIHGHDLVTIIIEKCQREEVT